MRSASRSLALIVLAIAAAPVLAQSARSPQPPSTQQPAPSSAFLPNAVITEGFDVVGGTPPCPVGWTCTQRSNPAGGTNWFQGNDTVFPAQAGATTSYIGANYNNTGSVGTI